MKTCCSLFLILLCGSLATTAQEPAPAGGNTPAAAHVEVELSAVECTFPQGANPLELHPATYEAIKKLPQKSIRVLDHVSGKGKSGEKFSANHIVNPVAKNTDSKQKADAAAFAPGESDAMAGLEATVGGTPAVCDVNITYHLRDQTDIHEPRTPQEINFTTSFTTGFDKPVVINVSAVPGHEGSFIAIVAILHLVDADGKPAGVNAGPPRK